MDTESSESVPRKRRGLQETRFITFGFLQRSKWNIIPTPTGAAVIITLN